MLITTANNLKVTTGDIGNAYLYAKSDLKTNVAQGEEFNVFDSKIQEHTIAAAAEKKRLSMDCLLQLTGGTHTCQTT
jgi:hypothetical protein